MVDSDGKREIPYTCDLEILAAVGLAEMASDLPPLQETCPRSVDSPFERRTAGRSNYILYIIQALCTSICFSLAITEWSANYIVHIVLSNVVSDSCKV